MLSHQGEGGCTMTLVCIQVQALLNIISNPVNSTVAIAAETLKKLGVYDPKRLFGVTTLDVVSAKPPTSELTCTSMQSNHSDWSTALLSGAASCEHCLW